MSAPGLEQATGLGNVTTTARDVTSAAFFEAKYRRDADPWAFASSDYERARYRAILRALDGQRYGRAFEPGCSVGVLTEQLAALCDVVEAIDLSETAVARARERCAALRNVHCMVGALPAALPDGSFDLVVLSEIGYYFTAAAWSAVLDRVIAQMPSGATLLAAHWLGHSADHLMSGDAVHALLQSRVELRLDYSERVARPAPEHGFRLDRWVRL